ncbi:asparagine synthase (glutamine-hydrolyzing) [Sphingomonas zeicaulis]|uniref:asparagine synthase-related protein n=1 Tax=Sphingomonas zeicaulis TaxID=1632740 RepID=UPI003D2392FD
MAMRYLLLVRQGRGHPPPAAAAFRRPQGLDLLVETAAVSLFAGRDAPWLRLADGMAIGHVFERDRCNEDVKHGAGARAGRRLAELQRTCWGAYVACGATRNGHEIFRDPTGQLPCYHAARGGIAAFASDIGLLVDAGIIAPAVDWVQLARSLVFADLLEPPTAIAGVSELLPGMAMELGDGELRLAMRWTPWDHVGGAPPSPQALRAVVTDCVSRWSTRFGRILIGASGGLDSSIVAVALAQRPAVDAVTISTSDPHGDERRYARLLSAHLGIALAEADYDLDAVDIARSSVAHRPRPGGRAQLQAYDAVIGRMIGGEGAGAFFTGVGGDNVFQFTRSARPVVDRLRAAPSLSGVAATLADIGTLTGASRWTVLRHGLRLLLSPSRTGWTGDQRFLTQDAVAAATARPADHPWLRRPADALLGKIAHVAMLVRAQSYMDVHDRRLPFTTVHPLLSQPIVEACLAVPSWQACAGGRNRAHARAAFAGDLPRDIIGRRGKGGPDSFAVAILRTRLRDARAMLLDGLLARHGIVSRPALEAALTEQAIMRGDDYVRILLLLDTEAWARHWGGG